MSLFNCEDINVITIDQGSTYQDSVIMVNPLTGDPYDLTGATAVSQVRDGRDGKLLGDFTCAVDGPNGRVNREIPPETTSTLPVGEGKFVWGIQVTLPNGYVFPEVRGGVTVTRQVVS